MIIHFWIFESITHNHNSEDLVMQALDDGEVQFKIGDKECTIDKEQTKTLIKHLTGEK